MNTQVLLAPADIGESDLPAIGGKARGLLQIHRAALHTPEWCVLSFAAVAARAWRDDEPLRTELTALFEACEQHVAVRSSSESEDGKSTSNAGQFLTRFVTTFDALLAALDAVAESARGAQMAIVLQRALIPEFAGVAFSADPASARADTFYVEAVPGHGKELVDGNTTPTALHIELDGNLLPGATEGRLRPSVSSIAPQLAHALLALEDRLDGAVDIEWAVAGGALYILQARPLTALAADAALRPATCHTSWFFDQRFLKPISPFTRSTLVPLVLRESLGSALEMRGHDPAEAHAFYYGGQAYVPHATWRHMLDGTPRWFLSPDLRQLFPARCACDEARPSVTMFGYAWDALRSVVQHRREVFCNISQWRTYRDALPSRIDSALAESGFAEQWRALDALSIEFLHLHRWSILWADYFFRAFNILARIVGVERANAALHLNLVTTRANAARERARAENSEAAWEAFAHEFGDRSDSLDYASPAWRELHAHERSETPRLGDHSPTTPNATRMLSWLLTPVRAFLEMREEQRFNWEHVLAAQRRLVLAQPVVDQLAQRDDVWLLRFEEFTAALDGAPLPKLAVLAARRHALRIEALVPKPLFLGANDAPRDASALGALQGAGASAGRARGTAVHVHDPTKGLPHGAPRPCIAVVRALDPAHTKLLREVDGIIAERGGLLSHAAILAREYRVPMVTAFEGAFDLVPDHSPVEIDGQTGKITRL